LETKNAVQISGVCRVSSKQQYEIMAHYLQTATGMGKRDEFLQHPQISGIMQNMMGDPVMMQSLQNLQNKQKNIGNA